MKLNVSAMINIFKKIDWFPIACAASMALIFLIFIFAADSEKKHLKTAQDLHNEYYEVLKLAIEKGWTPEQVKSVFFNE